MPLVDQAVRLPGRPSGGVGEPRKGGTKRGKLEVVLPDAQASKVGEMGEMVETPGKGGPASFAEDLRRLHAASGAPTYAQLTRVYDRLVSASSTDRGVPRDKARSLPDATMSDALSGRRLPTWPTVRAFVEACHEYARLGGFVDRNSHPDIEIWHRSWVSAKTGRSEIAHDVGTRPMTSAESETHERQLAYFQGPSTSPPAAVASISPPLGRRDPKRPLRHREQLLGRLVDALSRRDSEARVWVLYGLGGCGKTSVALELAQWAADNEVDAWWIAAAEESTLVAGLHTIARLLGATDEDLRQGYPPDVLWRRLNEHDRRWLLVIDNADDLDVLIAGTGDLVDGVGWLRAPLTDRGLVLVTSREGNPDSWGHWAKLQAVDTLTPTGGAEVLLDLAPEGGSIEEAMTLSQRLGGLPLALRLAGSYLSRAAENSPWSDEAESIATFNAYKDAVDQRLTHIFVGTATAGPAAEVTRRAITTTWELSLDLLENRGFPFARALMRLLSCLGDSPIPYALMLQPAYLAESPLFRDITGRSLWENLQALSRVGLVDLHYDSSATDQLTARTAVVHPLVRDVNRASAGIVDHADDFLSTVTTLVQRPTEKLSPQDPSNWPRWQVLVPHCPSALELLQLSTAMPSRAEVVAITGLCFRGAQYLREAGLFRQAEAAYALVVEARQRLLSEDDSETLGARHSLSFILWDLGELEQAEMTLRLVVDTATRSLGPDDFETLRSRHDLAVVLRTRAKFDEAEKILREVLRIRETVLGDEHSETLDTRHEIGFIVQDRGRLDEAEQIFRQVLEVRNRLNGKLSPEAMYLQHSIAYILYLRGMLSEAEDSFKSTLALSRALLGNEHPHTLSVANNLGLVLYKRGAAEEAENILRDALSARMRTIGPNHQDTLTSKHNIGLVLRHVGNLRAAEQIFREVDTERSHQIGTDHPSTLESRINLAFVLHALRRTDEAEQLLREVSIARKRVLGPDHPDTREAVTALADMKHGSDDTFH